MRPRDRRIVAGCVLVLIASMAANAAFAEQRRSRQITIEPTDPAAPGATAPALPAAPSGQPTPEAASAPPPSGGCETANFIGTKGMVEIVAADLGRIQSVRAKTTRYLTLTHFANLCVDDGVLNVYRQAVIKLLNSLSRSSEVVRLETIDPRQSIIRINIADLGWSAADWDAVLAVYPYGALPDTALNAVLERATQSKLAFVRADWFAFAASRPPLYGKLLALPPTLRALARDQGVDVEANIKNFLAQRAGFQKSGESLNNRLVERHPSRAGYFWMTYDFAGNRGRQNLFEFPLGPSGDQGFAHDASAAIFSLPNGFQAYYQSNAKGDVADRGPTQIVRDPNNPDLAVTTAISCMGCHEGGVRAAADEIRASALKGNQLPRSTRDAIEGLYPAAEKMERLVEGDAARFSGAMVRASLDPTLKLAGVEMITALSRQYERNVDATFAAAELGLTPEEFAKNMGDADKKLRGFLRRLQQGPTPRDQFEAVFADLVDAITDDEAVRPAPPAKTAQPAQPARVSPPPTPTRAAPPPPPRGPGGYYYR